MLRFGVFGLALDWLIPCGNGNDGAMAGWVLEETLVTLYKYTVTYKNREGFTESGTVVAKDEDAAKEKLRLLEFEKVKLKKLQGISALFKQFTADIK